MRCGCALAGHSAETVATCKKEAHRDRSDTSMEAFSAHDELGLALLQFANNPREALIEFEKAPAEATEGLTRSDGIGAVALASGCRYADSCHPQPGRTWTSGKRPHHFARTSLRIGDSLLPGPARSKVRP